MTIENLHPWEDLAQFESALVDHWFGRRLCMHTICWDQATTRCLVKEVGHACEHRLRNPDWDCDVFACYEPDECPHHEYGVYRCDECAAVISAVQEEQWEEQWEEHGERALAAHLDERDRLDLLADGDGAA